MKTGRRLTGVFLALVLLIAGAFAGAETPDSNYYDADGNMILPLVKEPVTFRVLWKKDPLDKGALLDKAILKEAFEKTGINFEVEEVSATAWDEKVAVVFASNDLPDLICGEIKSLINYTDQCVDLTDLLPVYAPFTNQFLTQQYPAAARAEAFGGRLYSLPSIRVNNLYPSLGFWEINTEWLKRVGMEIPTTVDELYEVLKAFKEKDANGNGDPGDEIPCSFVKLPDDVGLLNMMNCFGMINDGANKSQQYIMVENGKVLFTGADQRFYDMLVYLHKLYAEGLMDKDGFVQEKTDRYAKASDNRVGFMTAGGLITEAYGNDVGEQIGYLQPPKSQYPAVIKQNDPPAEMTLHMYTITKACKQPELLLLLAEYCVATPERRFETRFGPEGGAWEVGESGKYINTTNFDGKAYSNRAEAVATLSPFGRWPCILTYEEESMREYLGFSATYNTAKETIYGPDGGVAYKECFPLGNDTLENTAKRAEMFAEIDPYMQNFVAESVMNGIDEAKWEAHKQSCEKLNIPEFIADYQTLYDTLTK